MTWGMEIWVALDRPGTERHVSINWLGKGDGLPVFIRRARFALLPGPAS